MRHREEDSDRERKTQRREGVASERNKAETMKKKEQFEESRRWKL